MADIDTADTATLPFSMEIAGGILAERCYTDRQFHQEMLKDPVKAISDIIDKHTKHPIDLKNALPNCRVLPLQNTNKRWHIVLPFEYHGEPPSEDNGILSEEDLEQVTGGIFGLTLAAALPTLGAIAASVTFFGTTATGIPLAVAASVVGGTVVGPFLSTGVVAGITAGIIAGGATLALGITLAAIGGLDAGHIIDAF